jgi:hypothetical protein
LDFFERMHLNNIKAVTSTTSERDVILALCTLSDLSSPTRCQ